jgi:hypothetical protein
MKILAVVFVLFFSLFSFAQDDSLSINENIKLFNEAQGFQKSSYSSSSRGYGLR